MPDIPGNSSTNAVINGSGTYRSSMELNNDIDWWKVALAPGLTYDFMLIGDGTGTSIEGVIGLLDQYGSSLVSASDGNWIRYTPSAAGNFFISVSDSNRYDDAAEGPYVITARMGDHVRNDIHTTASINRSGVTKGALEATGDSDWYKLDLKAGQRVGFSVTADGNLTFDSAEVRLRDQYGTVLSQAGDGADYQATYTIVSSGTYFVEVVDGNNYDGQNEGAFALHSMISDKVWNNSTTTSKLIDGGTMRSAIDAWGDSDWHSFTAVAGRTYTFTMTGTGATNSLASMMLYLRDQSGTSLLSDSGYTSSGGASFTWTATRGGTYYLDASYRNYSGDSGDYTLSVLSNSPTLQGTAASEVLNGGANNNTINGRNGNDRIFGNDGNDTLSGDLGNDSLLGGNGNDVLIGGAGDDVLNGGAGADTAKYLGNAAVTVDLNVKTAQNTGHGRDTLTSIENVVGGNGADRITGDKGANYLTGNGGHDTLLGGLGADTLNGGAGNDLLDGGAGNDTVIFSGNGAITVDLNRTVAQNTGQGNDTIRNVENVTSGNGNDRLTGNALDNRLIGNGGNDTLSGGAGKDTLDGGAGNDVLDGGAGVDTLQFTGSAKIRVDLNLTGAQNTGQGTDTIRNIENVIGGSGNDQLSGNIGVNRLEGGAGNDRLFGRGGNDVLVGGNGSDWLEGGTGNDTLTGGAGEDFFVFGANNGNDRITDFQDGTDLIRITSGASSYNELDVQQVGSNTVVSFSGTSITLVGVSSWSIYTSDFVFE